MMLRCMRDCICGVYCAVAVVMICVGEDARAMLGKANSELREKCMKPDGEGVFPIVPSVEQEEEGSSSDKARSKATTETKRSIVDIAAEFCGSLQMPTEETVSFLKTVPAFGRKPMYQLMVPDILWNDIVKGKSREIVEIAIGIEEATRNSDSRGKETAVDRIIKHEVSCCDGLTKLAEVFWTLNDVDQYEALLNFDRYTVLPTIKEVEVACALSGNDEEEYAEERGRACELGFVLYPYFFAQLIRKKASLLD